VGAVCGRAWRDAPYVGTEANAGGSHSIVFDGEQAVELIDWDEGVASGLRLVDLAHAV
jgi:hypothetical protein